MNLSWLDHCKISALFLKVFEFLLLNPTLNGGEGGGADSAPPSNICSGVLNIDLRGTRLWYNSNFILTMKVLNPGNLKGVPPKKSEYHFGHRGLKFKMRK